MEATLKVWAKPAVVKRPPAEILKPSPNLVKSSPRKALQLAKRPPQESPKLRQDLSKSATRATFKESLTSVGEGPLLKPQTLATETEAAVEEDAVTSSEVIFTSATETAGMANGSNLTLASEAGKQEGADLIRDKNVMETQSDDILSPLHAGEEFCAAQVAVAANQLELRPNPAGFTRKRPSLTVDVDAPLADVANGTTLSGRREKAPVEAERVTSPILSPKARLARMREYGRQQRERRATLDALRRKLVHEKKLAAQALRRKQAERAKQVEAAQNLRKRSVARPSSVPATRRASERTTRPSEQEKNGSRASESGLRAPQSGLRPSNSGLRASKSGFRASKTELRVSGGRSRGAQKTKEEGGRSVGVKSPPPPEPRPTKWPDGRRSIRTQVPVHTRPEMAEDGPFSDGNRGGTRPAEADVSWDVSRAIGSHSAKRPGTAPSRIVRTSEKEVRGELLSPWSVPSAEESLIFDGATEELPRGSSGRALSASKMLQSDGPAVMTWQHPQPKSGSSSEQMDVPDESRLATNGQDGLRRIQQKAKHMSVRKEHSFPSDMDADTESLTPDSVVDAASEPSRLRRWLGRNGPKWPPGEDARTRVETEKRLTVLKEMAARIAKRLEELAVSGGQKGQANLTPEIETIVRQVEKLLRGGGKSRAESPPEKVEAPKRRRRKRASSKPQKLTNVNMDKQSAAKERRVESFSSLRTDANSLRSQRPLSAERSASDVFMTSALQDNPPAALEDGVNGALHAERSLRDELEGGPSHQSEPDSDADEGVTSTAEFVADVEAEIRELLERRMLERRRHVPESEGERASEGDVTADEREARSRRASAEDEWAAIVEGNDSKDDVSSEESETADDAPSLGERNAELRVAANVYEQIAITRSDPDLYADSDEDEVNIADATTKVAKEEKLLDKGRRSEFLHVESQPNKGPSEGNSVQPQPEATVLKAEAVLTVKQLVASSELEHSVPTKLPALAVPLEPKSDRLSIVHLYEKQLRERMERQQRQLEELNRKRKEEERKRNEEEEQRKELEERERIEEERKENEEKRREIEEKRQQEERKEVEEREWIEDERKGNEEKRRETEEELRCQEEEQKRNGRERERNGAVQRKEEKQSEEHIREREKEVVGLEVSRDDQKEKEKELETLVGKHVTEAKEIQEVEGTNRVNLEEKVGKRAESARESLPRKKSKGSKRQGKDELPVLMSSDVSNQQHVADPGVPNFFPQSNASQEKSKALLKSIALADTGNRMTPQMLEQMLQTEVARLEETGAMAQEVASLEHAQSIATAHQETVSLARLLEEQQIAHERNQKVDQLYREQQERLKETVEKLTKEIAADVRKESLQQLRTVADVFAQEVRKGGVREEQLLGPNGHVGMPPRVSEEGSLHQLRFYSSDESEGDVTSDVRGRLRVEEAGSLVQSENYSKTFEKDDEISEAISEGVSGKARAVSEVVSEELKAFEEVSEAVSKAVSEDMRGVSEAASEDSKAVSEVVSEEVAGVSRAVGEDANHGLEELGKGVDEVEEGVIDGKEAETYWRDIRDADATVPEPFFEEELEEEFYNDPQGFEEAQNSQESSVEESLNISRVDDDQNEKGLSENEAQGSIEEESQHYSDSFGRSVGAQVPSEEGAEQTSGGVDRPAKSAPQESESKEVAAALLHEASEKLRTEEELLFARKSALQEATRVQIERLGGSPDREAALRQQKLLRLQLDADLAEVDRALASMRAEFVRQRLLWESGFEGLDRVGAQKKTESRTESVTKSVAENVTESSTKIVTEELEKSEGSAISEEVESQQLGAREILEMSGTAFSSIAVRRMELELEAARNEAGRLQKEKREREIQEELARLNAAVNERRAVILAEEPTPLSAVDCQTPKPWTPLGDARPLPPLETLKPSEHQSESASIAYSDSFVEDEITKEDISEQSGIPSEVMGDSAGEKKGSEVAEKSASQSIQYSESFDQAGESEPGTSIATDGSQPATGRFGRWDEEVSSVMKGDVSKRHVAEAQKAGDWIQEADLGGVSKRMKATEEREDDLIEELPEEWSDQNRQTAVVGSVPKASLSDGLAEQSPERAEEVLSSPAKRAEPLDIRKESDEPEYSDSFASDADVEDDVSSAPAKIERIPTVTSGQQSGSKENPLFRSERESPSAWQLSKGPRAFADDKSGQNEILQYGSEITGVEDLEEVKEELEFDENGFEVSEQDESAAVQHGGMNGDHTGDGLQGKLNGISQKRLVKATDGVLVDLLASEIQDAAATLSLPPTRSADGSPRTPIRTKPLNPKPWQEAENATPPSPRSPGSPSRAIFDSEAKWINPQNLSPRNSPRSSPPLHVPLGIAPMGAFEIEAAAAHSQDSGGLRVQSFETPEPLGMSRLSPKDFADLNGEEEEFEDGFEEQLEPNPLAVEADAAYVEEYVGEVLAVSGFLEERSDWFQRNQPLGLDVFVRLEKLRPDVHDFQHIFNKLIFDAVGEALVKEITPHKPREPWDRTPKSLKPRPDGDKLLAAVRKRTLEIYGQRAPVGPLKEDALRSIMKEKPWVNFPEEEHEVSCEVADLLVNNLVDETVELLLRAQRGTRARKWAHSKASVRLELTL